MKVKVKKQFADYWRRDIVDFSAADSPNKGNDVVYYENTDKANPRDQLALIKRLQKSLCLYIIKYVSDTKGHKYDNTADRLVLPAT